MITKGIIKRFANEEFGNAVVDWTVLMAGVVLMAIAVVLTVTNNVDAITDNTNAHMTSVQISQG